MSFFDDLETRSADQRANDLALALPTQIANAQKLSGYSDDLGAVEASAIQTIDDLAGLPVLRKSCLLYTSPSPRDLSTSRMPSSA